MTAEVETKPCLHCGRPVPQRASAGRRMPARAVYRKPQRREREVLCEEMQTLNHWRKEAAGRLLDGREWNQYPEAL